MSDYDDIIKGAADAFANMLGTDEMADIWGDAADMRLKQLGFDLEAPLGTMTPEEQNRWQLAYEIVYRDIFRAAAAQYDKTVAEMMGREYVAPLTHAELDAASAVLGNEADRLHENASEGDYPDEEEESEECAELSARLSAIAGAMTDPEEIFGPPTP
jgi:hypothetical protein